MRIKQGVIRSLVVGGMALALLAGCEGVGDGNKPESVEIRKLTRSFFPGKAFTCFGETLQLVGTFNKGDLADFTSRATWTSSNKDVLFVSNRGDSVPAFLGGAATDVFLVSGQVFPLMAGTATITGNAFGLVDVHEFTVADPTNIRVKAAEYAVADATSIKIAQGRQQELRLSATFDGHVFDNLANLAEWEFVTPNDDVATFIKVNGIPTNFILATNKTDGPTLTARAKLPGCATSNPLLAGAQIDVSVATATGLLIQRELDNPVNGNVLAVNTATPLLTSEILRVYATFDGNSDPAQNLSNQVLSSSSNTGVITPLAFNQSTGITALSTGTGTEPPDLSEDVTLKYCQPEPIPDPVPSGYTSKCWDGQPEATIVFKTRKSVLTDIAVTPVDGVIEALKTLQFRAVGTFEGGFQQDITRNVTWEAFANDGTTKSTKVGIVSAGNVLAGLAAAPFLVNADTDDSNGTPLQDRTVKIKATNNGATTTKTQTVTATLSQ